MRIRECLESLLIGGAQILALPAMILLMVGYAVIYQKRKFTVHISVEFSEQSSDESRRT